MLRGKLGLQLTQKEKQFAQFQQWIQTKYQFNSFQGWETIILSQAEDEKLTFDFFFELFEQFNLESLQLDKTNCRVGSLLQLSLKIDNFNGCSPHLLTD